MKLVWIKQQCQSSGGDICQHSIMPPVSRLNPTLVISSLQQANFPGFILLIYKGFTTTQGGNKDVIESSKLFRKHLLTLQPLWVQCHCHHTETNVCHQLTRCAEPNQTVGSKKKDVRNPKKEKSHIQISRGKSQPIIYKVVF